MKIFVDHIHMWLLLCMIDPYPSFMDGSELFSQTAISRDCLWVYVVISLIPVFNPEQHDLIHPVVIFNLVPYTQRFLCKSFDDIMYRCAHLYQWGTLPRSNAV